ncbi:ParB N-terminal domain-containing protein [Ruminococcaceae bacterium OttesenSCG-928-I18]|nr:ParB N-terminal domain-containing protein [Ruminococcaceae bacterium OttesenSCG-928-I18]
MIYQVMPDLSPEEYEELKADIAARGVMVPIEFDEQGNVLDGHHRLKICADLGLKDYPKVIRAGMTEDDKRLHARKLNCARRHLNAEQKRELIRQQLSETPEKSDRQIAAGLGVSHPTVGAVRNEMVEAGNVEKFTTSIDTMGREQPRQRKPVSVFNPTRREEKAIQDPDVVDRLATGQTSSVLSASKQVNREAKAERKAYEAPTQMPDNCQVFVGDIRDGLPSIPDESVDFIITDPPYPREYVPLYGDLSRLAERVLNPGGSLIVMTGQSYLPDVMTELGREMTYHWCMAYMTPGGQSPQLWHKRTNTFWKPVLWFTKGEYGGDMVGDVLKSPPNNNDKLFHEWGQSLGGMQDIVERFTYPGDLILDPFLGGGTTGVAAVLKAREFIGADANEECVATSKARILEAIADAGCAS